MAFMMFEDTGLTVKVGLATIGFPPVNAVPGIVAVIVSVAVIL